MNDEHVNDVSVGDEPELKQPINDRPVVVGIGASAGGLEAISQLLKGIPEDSGMSFVIIQHLDPTHKSSLVEILSRRTSLSIQQVEEDTEVEPNHVYVIPPGQYLSIEGCVLKLSEPQDPRGSRMAIDYFLTSLAQDACEFGVGVVLSGTGSDGTAGLQEIKHYGGLTVVQDPTEAEHSGMPLNAIDAVHVDYVLSASEIGLRLKRYVDFCQTHGPLSAQSVAIAEQSDLTPILNLLRTHLKLDFRRYRRNTLMRRIQRRMGLHQLDQLSDYRALLADNAQEREALRCDLLIGVTRFFRNPESWEVLEEKVVRPMLEAERTAPVRVWCAGCATGEEAYSIAMLLLEQIGADRRKLPFQIFATDLADDALSFARTGLYPESIMKDVPLERLRRFFKKEPNGYRVSKQLRESVVFANQNVLAQPPFAKLDLILCRNLLIYLQREAQDRVMNVFQFALKEGGVLFQGSSETVGQASDLFAPVSKKHRIYRRTGLKAWPPAGGDYSANVQPLPEFSARERKAQSNQYHADGIAAVVQRQLLQQLGHGVIVVNRDNRVLFAEGEADLYVQLGLGELSAELPDVMQIARKGIKAKLRSSLREVWNGQTSLSVAARVHRDGVFHPCELQISKLPGRPEDDPAAMVIFTPGEKAVRESTSPKPSLSDEAVPPSEAESRSIAAEQSLMEVEHELAITREQLNSSISDLESANEELKAANEEAMTMNEELQSSNEELETSKEELQSLNEELTTLNNQLEIKVDELEDITNDLENLLTSSDIPTVFLDMHFRIRRYTPSSRDLFHFIAGDIGRPLGDIKADIDDPDLLDDAKAVLHDLQPREKQVASSDGKRHYRRRMLPYRTEDNRIQGVVVTLTDITDLVEAREEAANRHAELKTIYESAPVGLSFIDSEMRFININEQMAQVNGFPREEHIGKTLEDMLPKPLTDSLIPVYRQVFESGEGLFEQVVMGKTHESSEQRIWLVNFVPVRNKANEVLGVNTVVQDVTNRHAAEVALREKELQFRMALHAGKMAAWEWTPEFSHWEPALFDLLGIPSDTAPSPERFFEAVHPSDLPGLKDAWQRATVGDDEYYHEFRIIRPDGTLRWLVGMGLVSKDDAGEVERIYGLNWDITEQRDREAALRRIIDNQLGLVGVLESDGTLIEANAASTLAAGVTREDVIGKKFWDCYWWSYDQDVANQLREAFEKSLTGEVVRYDVPVRMVNDTRMMIDFMLAPVCDDDGRVTHVIPSAVDISERYAAAEELAMSRNRLKNAMQAARMGSFVWDRITDETMWDDEWEKAVGIHGVKEKTGKVFFDMVHPDDLDYVNKMVQDSLTGKVDYKLEFRIIRPDGQIRWLAGAGDWLDEPNGQPRKMAGINWDITEQKLIEHEIRLNEERLRVAAGAAGFGAFHIDLSSNQVDWSDEFKALVGISPHDHAEIAVGEVPKFVHPDDRPKFQRHMNEVLSDLDEPDHGIVYRIVRSEGEVRHVRMQTRSLYDGEGESKRIRMIVGTLLDITAQRVSEQNLKKAMRQAEAASESKSEFLANMSHEIRTPMTAILGYADLLADRVEDEQSLRHLQTIRRNGDFLLDIINDILDLSKVEAGRLEIVPERFSPIRLIEEVRSVMEVRASGKDLTMQVSYESKLPATIESDPRRLRQILINLVGNAIKFTKKGGVRILVNYIDGKLQVRVVDTGIGITEEQQKRLFQPFSQADNTVSREFGGTGLGLTISRRLAELLGGSVGVESEEGKGSTFTVRVAVGGIGNIEMITPEPTSEPVVNATSEDDVQLDCRILVVDDRRDVRFLARHFLSDAGATVSEAENGELGVTAVTQSLAEGPVFELVILDMQMPQLNGYQAAKAMRQAGYSGPIIALTADAMHGDMARCLEAGCNDYLSKPIDRSELLMKVKQYLESNE